MKLYSEHNTMFRLQLLSHAYRLLSQSLSHKQTGSKLPLLKADSPLFRGRVLGTGLAVTGRRGLQLPCELVAEHPMQEGRPVRFGVA